MVEWYYYGQFVKRAGKFLLHQEGNRGLWLGLMQIKKRQNIYRILI